MAQSDENARSETDKALSRHLQVKADRALLGTSPGGAIVRIVGFITLFILLGGGLMVFLNSAT